MCSNNATSPAITRSTISSSAINSRCDSRSAWLSSASLMGSDMIQRSLVGHCPRKPSLAADRRRLTKDKRTNGHHRIAYGDVIVSANGKIDRDQKQPRHNNIGAQPRKRGEDREAGHDLNYADNQHERGGRNRKK